MRIFLPDRGAIRVLGDESWHAASDRVTYRPEERGLYKKMKGREVLRFYAELKGMRNSGPAIAEWLGAQHVRLTSGTVVVRMVIGAAVQCVVRLDDGQEVLTRTQRTGDTVAEELAEGERVMVSWGPEAALELTGGSSG